MESNDKSTQSTRERFSQVQPDQFREQIVGLRQAEDALRDTIVESVENGWVTPVQGIDLISAATATIYQQQPLGSSVYQQQRQTTPMHA